MKPQYHNVVAPSKIERAYLLSLRANTTTIIICSTTLPLYQKRPPPPMMPIRSRHYSRGSHQALLFLYIAQSVTFCCLVFSIMLKKIWVLQREHTELNILLKHSCMYFRFEFLTCIQFWDSMIFEVSATALLFRALAKHSISLAITMVEVLSAMWF